ncbi:FHA domain containing protein, putative [Babesia caballi]|uniref:FHA domain containing protein, putative n=1 Tax=Babesia caballi TaxID=5871 RepID=A0AAV4LLJ4_BABCB|nr:FHA domain containing protein, putative [Babesia caballi]
MEEWARLELALPRVVRRLGAEGRGVPSYLPPPWADFDPREVLGKDAEAYSVDVISNGTLLENVQLGKAAHCVLGSMDECELVYKNPLVSRRHLVLQLNRYGRLLLFDLGSTHGTTVNHRRVEPEKYHMLAVGDQIRIGQRGSTSRTYVVCGPEEVEPACDDSTASGIRPRKVAKSLAERDEQEIMDKVKRATAADYYDTSLDFDELDDYYDRERVKELAVNKRKQKTHTAASLRGDLARLYREEVGVINRWHEILREARDAGLICEQQEVSKCDTPIKSIQRKGFDEDRAKLQEQVDRIRAEIDRYRKLLRLTRSE